MVQGKVLRRCKVISAWNQCLPTTSYSMGLSIKLDWTVVIPDGVQHMEDTPFHIPKENHLIKPFVPHSSAFFLFNCLTVEPWLDMCLRHQVLLRLKSTWYDASEITCNRDCGSGFDCCSSGLSSTLSRSLEQRGYLRTGNLVVPTEIRFFRFGAELSAMTISCKSSPVHLSLMLSRSAIQRQFSLHCLYPKA